MILDCSDYESTKKSVIDIFNTSDAELSKALKSIDPYESHCQSPEEVLYEKVCRLLGEPNIKVNVLWFHGSRVEDESLFYKYGILTKSKASEFIEPRLKEMSYGMNSHGEHPFSVSLSGKQGEHDEGPFAFLFKDVAIYAPSPNHNYLEAPEIVEDIAGTLLGQNYMQLVDTYKKASRPCLVSFVAESKDYELPYALFYLRLIEDGESHYEAASSSNTFFDSENVIVSPDRIKSVEIIENV